MSDEDSLSHHEHEFSHPNASLIQGSAEGGPLDGTPIDIAVPLGVDFAGMVLFVATGQSPGAEQSWHAYGYGQRPRRDAEGRVVDLEAFWKHLGAGPDGPALPGRDEPAPTSDEE